MMLSVTNFVRCANIHSGSFNDAEQFSIDVSFNTFSVHHKVDTIKPTFALFTSGAFPRNDRWIFINFWTFIALYSVLFIMHIEKCISLLHVYK